MKKIGSGGLACELELVVAEEFGGYANRKLYVIESRPGLFRRLTAAAGKDDPEAVAAVFDGKLVHLKRQSAIENELSEAGYRHTAIETCTTLAALPSSWGVAVPTFSSPIPAVGTTPPKETMVDEGDIESTAEPENSPGTYAGEPDEVECDF